MPRRRRTYPGSIYKPKDVDRLYIKVSGRRIATGLRATKDGYRLAELMLERMYLEQHDLLPVRPMSAAEMMETFERDHPKLYSTSIWRYRSAFLSLFDRADIMSEKVITQRVLSYVNTTTDAPVTITGKVGVAQTILNYFSNIKVIKPIDLTKYRSKVQHGSAKTFKDAELFKLLRWFAKHDREAALMMLFQLHTGARVVDCLTLQKADVNGDIIYFKNKIMKTPEPRPLSVMAQRILAKVMTLNPQNPKLFRWRHPSTYQFYKLFARALKGAGVDGNGRGPQEFRVGFRMRLLRAGVPERVIQYFMRHSEGSTADKYYTDTDMRHYINYLT